MVKHLPSISLKYSKVTISKVYDSKKKYVKTSLYYIAVIITVN